MTTFCSFCSSTSSFCHYFSSSSSFIKVCFDVNSIIICKITNILLHSHHIPFLIQLFSRQHNHSILYTSQNRIIAPSPTTIVCCSLIIYQLTRFIMSKAFICHYTIFNTILEKCQLFISPSMNHSS